MVVLFLSMLLQQKLTIQ